MAGRASPQVGVGRREDDAVRIRPVVVQAFPDAARAFRDSSALLPKSFERPGPKSVSPATYCSGVEVVVWWRWIVDMRAPFLGGVTLRCVMGENIVVIFGGRVAGEAGLVQRLVAWLSAHKVSKPPAARRGVLL